MSDRTLTRTWLALGLFAFAGWAGADTVLTLQQGVNGYGGVEDVWWDNWSSATEVRSYGAYGNIYFYNPITTTARKPLLRFKDLDTAIPVASSEVTKATLKLFEYKCEYPNNTQTDNVAIYRVLRDWVEGDTNKAYVPQTGACLQYYTGSRHVGSGDWTLATGQIDGQDIPVGTNIWAYQVGTGDIVDKVMFDQEWSSSNWDMKANAADLFADTTSGYQVGDTVYVNDYEATATKNPGGGSHGFSFYLDEDRWNPTGSTGHALGCTGDADIDKTDPILASWDDLIWDYAGYTGSDKGSYEGEAGWVEVDITALVQFWMDNPDQNFGVMIAKNNGASGRSFFSSELGMFDVVRRKVPGEYQYSAADAIDLSGSGYTPMLVIEYVPEPATIGLLGIGLAGLATLRRKRH
jgi:hypothetical protein